MQSAEQKRKSLRGSVDLEKVKCVETVQPEPNAPQERMFAFQVNILNNLHSKDTTIMVVTYKTINMNDSVGRIYSLEHQAPT